MADAFNLSRLDVATLARSHGVVQSSETPASGGVDWGSRMDRLATEACVAGGLRAVTWRLQAELRDDALGVPQPWLHMEASASLSLVCQRCLEPVAVPLDVDRWFRFVADEATASEQDDVSEEDVLALEPKLDAATLIEDELIMAIPLVPLHTACPVPVTMSVVDPAFDQAQAEVPHPFAGLDVALRNKS